MTIELRSVDPTIMPTTAQLEAGLRGLPRLGGTGPLRVLGREDNTNTSSFPSEIVVVGDGTRQRSLFCKHGKEYSDRTSGMRRGVGYEALVYEQWLGDLAPAPRWYGAFQGSYGSTLVLAALQPAVRLGKATDGPESAVARAAAELGRWQRQRAAPTLGDFNRYDVYHLDRWAHRAAAVNEGWLAGCLSLRIVGAVRELLTTCEQTIVHGELFPANILSGSGRIWFVDWESAGAGCGEIDLAALTLGTWSEATRVAAEAAYVVNRWPQGPPDSFNATFAAARLYMLAYVARHHARRQPDRPPKAWIAEQAVDAVRTVRRMT